MPLIHTQIKMHSVRKTLDIEIEIQNGAISIEGFSIDGKPVDMKLIRESNQGLDESIDNAIDKYCATIGNTIDSAKG